MSIHVPCFCSYCVSWSTLNNRGPTDPKSTATTKNTKLKLLNVASWYNEICEAKQRTPKYCSVKSNGNNRPNRAS